MNQRNPAFDWCKGVLIVLVIVGHWVLGSVDAQPVRYAIYAFHMPLFIALSGFFLNAESLRTTSVFETGERYFHRVVLPFIPAFLFFTGILILHASQEGRLDSALLVGYLTTPYYHLWYIPTLLLWVGMTVLFVKARMPILLVLLGFVVPALSWAGYHWIDASSPMGVLVDKKVFFYAYFFFLGMLCGAHWEKLEQLMKSVWPILTVITVGMLFVVMSYLDSSKDAGHALAWFVMNSLLVVLMLFGSNKSANKVSSTSFLVNVGRNSLPIYLWHVLPLFLLKGLDVHQTQPILYYILSALTIAGLVAFVLRFESRSGFLDRWLYGVPSSK